MTKSLIQPQDRLGLSRTEASEYIGVGVGLFDLMVKDGRMPPPRHVNSRLIWARKEVEKHFVDLPYADVVAQNGESPTGWDMT
jgi:predicted DNA-binding transcriptional regulator AlpA